MSSTLAVLFKDKIFIGPGSPKLEQQAVMVWETRNVEDRPPEAILRRTEYCGKGGYTVRFGKQQFGSPDRR
jgi:hypothetical protein